MASFDSTASVSGQTGTSAATGSLTIAANANRVLVVAVARCKTTTPPTVNSVVWDNAGVAESLTQFNTNSGNQAAPFIGYDYWYKINPTAKTATVTITLSTTSTEWFAVAQSFYNVSQTTPLAGGQFISNVFGGGSTLAFNMVTVAGDMVSITGATDYHGVTSTSGTQDFIDTTGSGGGTYLQGVVGHASASGTSTSINVVFDSPNDGQDASAVVIKDAATPLVPQLQLRPRGELWPAENQLRQQLRPLSPGIPGQSVDNPPGVRPSYDIRAWFPPPPQPWQMQKLSPGIPGQSVDNPIPKRIDPLAAYYDVWVLKWNAQRAPLVNPATLQSSLDIVLGFNQRQVLNQILEWYIPPPWGSQHVPPLNPAILQSSLDILLGSGRANQILASIIQQWQPFLGPVLPPKQYPFPQASSSTNDAPPPRARDFDNLMAVLAQWGLAVQQGRIPAHIAPVIPSTNTAGIYDFHHYYGNE